MIINKAKLDTLEAVVLHNILAQIKAKSPNLFAKIQNDYKKAVDDGASFNAAKMLIEILES